MAWCEYPRPQLRRSSYFSLSGEWELAFSRKREIPKVFPYQITVPYPPESPKAGVAAKRRRGELLYYRRRFRLPEGFHLKKTLLHFDAVDQIATVIFNGEPLYTHEGGYLPFSVDVSAHLQEENELVVAVVDELSHDYPYGKQRKRRGGMWYTPVSGIWQSVWMESFPEGGIYGIRIHANEKLVHIEVESDAKELFLSYFDGVETVMYSFTGGEIILKPRDRHVWSPEDPYLYRFTVRSATDEADGYFALRRLDSRVCEDGQTRFFLNGKPYFLHGVLDQGYYPEGVYTPSEGEDYLEDVLRAKRLGFNMIRKHIKVESALFYHYCDRVGMIVCQDAVNNGSYSFLWHTALPTLGMKNLPSKVLSKSRRARKIFYEHTSEMLSYLTQFPSVMLFTIFNEGWGQADAEGLYSVFKKKYPAILFDTASGWFRTDATDMRSDHVYFKKITPNYKGEALPILLSEFGGYSLPVSGHTYPSGRNYGYARCRSSEDLTERLLRLYREEVIPAVREGLGGAVITQLYDIEDETNGFYTYDREVLKVPKDAFAALHDEIFAALGGVREKNE